MIKMIRYSLLTLCVVVLTAVSAQVGGHGQRHRSKKGKARRKNGKQKHLRHSRGPGGNSSNLLGGCVEIDCPAHDWHGDLCEKGHCCGGSGTNNRDNPINFLLPENILSVKFGPYQEENGCYFTNHQPWHPAWGDMREKVDVHCEKLNCELYKRTYSLHISAGRKAAEDNVRVFKTDIGDDMTHAMGLHTTNYDKPKFPNKLNFVGRWQYVLFTFTDGTSHNISDFTLAQGSTRGCNNWWVASPSCSLKGYGKSCPPERHCYLDVSLDCKAANNEGHFSFGNVIDNDPGKNCDYANTVSVNYSPLPMSD